MNRTKAEQALLQNFEAAAGFLPGKGWVEDLRREAIGVFAGLGLPSRRVEAWKYTDLRERMKDVPPVATQPAPLSSAAFEAALGPLASLDSDRVVFVDGRFDASLSRLPTGEGIEAMPLGGMLTKAPAWMAAKFSPERADRQSIISVLNMAFMADGLMLKVKAGTTPARPVLLVMATASPNAGTATLRNIVSVEAGGKLTLIEVHVALDGASVQSHSNSASDVDLADGAEMSHLRCAVAGSAGTQLSQWRARLGASAGYRAFQLTAGVATARNEIVVGFTGSDARLDVSGAFLARGNDHVDTTLVVDHSTPGCESRELFKGVLDGRARGVFQGKIIVQPEAQKTDGKQMAQALMLSEDAEFDSKPELEIYADDVACGHGSTAAELDSDMLFYLRSRGLPKAEARALLIESFVGEAIDKIEDEAVREAFMTIARRWLAGG